MSSLTSEFKYLMFSKIKSKSTWYWPSTASPVAEGSELLGEDWWSGRFISMNLRCVCALTFVGCLCFALHTFTECGATFLLWSGAARSRRACAKPQGQGRGCRTGAANSELQRAPGTAPGAHTQPLGLLILSGVLCCPCAVQEEELHELD